MAGLADRVAVMYAGRVVEIGPVGEVLRRPQHPYTRALLRSMPRVDESPDTPLVAIGGSPPNPKALPAGCPFHPRCEFASDTCRTERPTLQRAGGGSAACHHKLDDPASAAAVAGGSHA